MKWEPSVHHASKVSAREWEEVYRKQETQSRLGKMRELLRPKQSGSS